MQRRSPTWRALAAWAAAAQVLVALAAGCSSDHIVAAPSRMIALPVTVSPVNEIACTSGLRTIPMPIVSPAP